MSLLSKIWSDIVFEGRNKDYGAYRLRKETGKRHAIALAWVGAFCVVTVLCILMTHFVSYSTRVKTVQVRDISMLKPAENKKKVHDHARPAMARAEKKGDKDKADIPLIAQDGQVAEEETASSSGSGTGAAFYNYADTTAVDSTATLHNAVNANEREEDYKVIAQLPEYPGGMVAFMKWLTANLKYPKTGNNNDGRVVVQFIVKKDGAVDELKIVRSLSPQCDREVLRVLKMMPRWKPGTENGNPVATQMVIPINFHS